MNPHPSTHIRTRGRRGVALIIVLAMIVLVTGLVVAFFSRAVTSRQVSNNSAAQAKAAIMAQSAGDSIVADFKWQITLSSSAVPLTGGSSIYVPNSNTSMVPTRYGAFVSSTAAANLICYSTRTGTSNYSGSSVVSITGSASAVNSYTDPSNNGISITPRRWNSHYLLPRSASASTTLPDSTPQINFAPDWVYMNRSGPVVVNAGMLVSSASSINNPLASNTNYVVGRYAYAVYDEGGLLDVNAAGFPSVLAGSTAAAHKGALAMADLTQIGLRSADIDNIVGWRNFASSQLGSASFPNTSFSTTTGSTWYQNFVLSNTTGFISVISGTNNGMTDQAFLSRQQLIKFFTQGLAAGSNSAGLVGLQNALQYLATFTRSIEQPSYIRPVSLPVITGSALPYNGNSSVPNGGYQGNNTCWGADASINLTGSGFLSVRTGATTFTRTDGTVSFAGEPLVKRKFALSRLIKVNSSATTPTISSPPSSTGTTTEPIYDQFGLFRSGTSQPWTYNHDPQGRGHILTLTEVAGLNREPDFAELLKAAINVGSLGKAAPNGVGLDYQYTLDKSVDFQILQIMANLIDQTKTDSFPTRIQYMDSSGKLRTFCGVEDLPYFYRWHEFNICTKVPIITGLPNSQVSGSDSITLQNYPVVTGHPQVSSTQNVTINSARYLGPSRTIQDPGSVALLIIPEVWNPHDPNMPVTNSRPTQFQMIVETNDPLELTGTWGICAVAGAATNHFDGWGAPSVSGTVWYPSLYLGDPTPSTPVALGTNNAAITFSDNNGQLFHEPTLLWRKNMPNGVNLQGQSFTDVLSTESYVGIQVGQVPAAWQVSFAPTFTGTISASSNTGDPTISGSSIPTPTYVFQTRSLHKGPDPIPNPSGPVTDCLTFRLQYKDGSGNWIDYDVKYSYYEEGSFPTHNVFVNQFDWATKKEYLNPLGNVNGNTAPMLYLPCGAYDPRTARFSMYGYGTYTDDDPSTNSGSPSLEVPTMVNNNPPSSAAANQAVDQSQFVLMATQRPGLTVGQQSPYEPPCGSGTNAIMRWFSSVNWTGRSVGSVPDAVFRGGLLCQNNPAQKTLGMDRSTQQSEYCEDPDGVCRRAMAGYVPVSTSGTTVSTSIGMPLVTSGTTFTSGTVNPTTQSQSRPIILHRPFRSVGEMSYAFRGSPWKNIDFFSPESGDVALLDVFCVNEPPSNAIVAGKVNLNTRQAPVLEAILSGAYRDELPINTLPPLSSAGNEIGNLANTLLAITTGTQAWRGPLTNVADMVGHFVSTAATITGTDCFIYPANSVSTTGVVSSNGNYIYSGFSSALSGTAAAQDGSDIWNPTSSTSSRNIQRFRESAIRPLADCGQTRVWNLLIDVIAQSGKYPQGVSNLQNGFYVEGEKRYWIHVAIDRSTGVVIDRQVEAVTE